MTSNPTITAKIIGNKETSKGIFRFSFEEFAMTKGLNIHEWFEIISKKGVEPHKILQAVENGETLGQFITKTSTGKNVLMIDDFTEIWETTKILYKEIKSEEQT